MTAVRTRLWQWWPLLLGPLGIIGGYVQVAVNEPGWRGRGIHEEIAILLTSMALGLAVVHLAIGRQRLHMLLTALAITVLAREIHWDWTANAVYIAIALIGVWGYAWRAPLGSYVDRLPHVRIWLITTASLYVLSQLIARRVFRGVLPNEVGVYSDMEELVENVAHGALLVTIALGPWRRAPRDP